MIKENMTHDEAIALAASLSKKDRVKYRIRVFREGKYVGYEEGQGIFDKTWWAGDALAFTILTDSNQNIDVIPELGDSIEKLP
jgi:hypothetical protein